MLFNNSLFRPRVAYFGLVVILLWAWTIILPWATKAKKGLVDDLEDERHSRQQSLADGCKMVYVDVGTNIGVQIRKIYEPHLFPQATILPLFNQHFGTDRRKVCSFGFEPNPLHTPELKAVETAYRKQRWPVTIYSETAAGTHDGKTSLHLDTAPEHLYWGASTTNKKNTGQAFEVNSLDLKRWLLNIKDRTYDNSTFPNMAPKVVMKLDVEGSEYDILPNLVLSGAICFVDLLMIEWHPDFNTEEISTAEAYPLVLKSFLSRASWCKTQILDIDDETYYQSSSQVLPLPT